DGPSTISVGTDASMSINGGIVGTGPLTKTSSGNLWFGGSAANTYSGDTLVNRGTLSLNKPAAVTAVPGHLVIGSGAFNSPATVRHLNSFAIVGSVTVNRGGLWDLNGFAEGFGIAELQGRAPLTLNDGGSVQTGS